MIIDNENLLIEVSILVQNNTPLGCPLNLNNNLFRYHFLFEKKTSENIETEIHFNLFSLDIRLTA